MKGSMNCSVNGLVNFNGNINSITRFKDQLMGQINYPILAVVRTKSCGKGEAFLNLLFILRVLERCMLIEKSMQTLGDAVSVGL